MKLKHLLEIQNTRRYESKLNFTALQYSKNTMWI